MPHRLNDFLEETGLCDDTLEHSGVKGMRWGIRKKEVSSKTQEAIQNLKTKKIDFKNVKRIANKQSSYGMLPYSSENLKAIANAERNKRYAKQDVSSSKILDKLNSKPKSNYQLKMEDKYKKKGLDNESAAIAAYKNIRVKKILATTAVLTMAVGAYKLKEHNMDKIIKVGSSMQRISDNPDNAVKDAFYAANNRLDKIRYKGWYGDVVYYRNDAAYQKNIQVLKEIKQASPKNAKKILNELYKSDPKFAEDLKTFMKNGTALGNPIYGKLERKALAGIVDKGKLNKSAYEYVNGSLVDHSPEMQALTDKYYKKLMEKGYNAIKDVNDAKYSGYKALNPVIAFGVKDKIDVASTRKLDFGEIKKAKTFTNALVFGPEVAKQLAMPVAGLYGTKKAVDGIQSKSTTKIVNKYKNEHPATKMTNTEIARMLKRG